MSEKSLAVISARAVRRLAGLAALILFAATAGTAWAGDIRVEGAMARLSNDQANGHRIEVYMDITNAGAVDRLYAVRSELSRQTMLSIAGSMPTQGNGMAMDESKHHATASLELRAGETVSLSQGSAHIMLMNPVHLPADGSTFPVILFFERAGKVTVPVTMNSANLAIRPVQ